MSAVYPTGNVNHCTHSSVQQRPLFPVRLLYMSNFVGFFQQVTIPELQLTQTRRGAERKSAVLTRQCVGKSVYLPDADTRVETTGVEMSEPAGDI
jgi:hypothetical protein